jgi:hypothetical protein
VCDVIFAYDVGLSIDLEACTRRLAEITQRARIAPKHRTPRYFEYRPAPWRITPETAEWHFDQYLARVYRLASQRCHLADWDASIMRKLYTMESIYEKIAD